MTPEDCTAPGVSSESRKALVLACGNSLRGDDGVGWRIGSLLLEDPPCDGIEVILTQQLLPEHAELVSRADTVVFLDCSVLNPLGMVTTTPILASGNQPSILTHHVNPEALLQLAQNVYRRSPSCATAITIGGNSFDLIEQLSAPVAAAIPKALEAVRALLGEEEAFGPLLDLDHADPTCEASSEEPCPGQLRFRSKPRLAKES